MTGPTCPCMQILSAYQAAVLVKNADALSALYDDDVCIFDLWGSWSIRGLTNWRAMIQEWFASLGNEQVTVDFQQVQSFSSGDLAIGHALLTFTAHSAQGEILRSFTNRITLALKSDGNAWKIIHEHTSVPIHPESMKAITTFMS